MTRPADASVDAYLAALEHPLKDVVLELCPILLGIDPAITEAVKWNAPSFRTTGHFATLQLRSPKAVKLILHLGAKRRALPPGAIADPGGWLTGLGADRASLGVASKAELAAKKTALQAIVRQWIVHVGGTAD